MKIVPVVRKALLKDIDESYEDMLYWLSKTPQERIAEVTRLRSHFLTPGQRIDKTHVFKTTLHPERNVKKKIYSKFEYECPN